MSDCSRNLTSSTSLSVELHQWAGTELFAVSKRVRNVTLMPSSASLEKICCGKNKQIWLHLLKHVHSRATVCKVRNELALYKRNFEKPITLTDLQQKKVKLQSHLSALSDKKTFLEDQIDNYETELDVIQIKINDLCQTTMKEQKFLGFLFLSVCSFNHKENYFQHLLEEINACIKKYKKDINNLTIEKQMSSLFINSSNFISCFDSKSIISSIKSTFNKLIRANLNDFREMKKDIWEKTENVLNDFPAVNIISGLQEQCKTSIELLNKLLHQSSEEFSQHMFNKTSNDIISMKSKSITSIELQQQKISHINEYIKYLNFQNNVANITEQLELSFNAIKQQLSSFAIDEELKTSYVTLLSKESYCHSLVLAIQYLESIISDIEIKTKEIHKNIDDEISKTHEIYHNQSLIISKRNALCEFLKQNGKVISRSSEVSKNMYQTIMDRFVLQKNATETFKDAMKNNLEKEFKLIAIIKKEFLKETGLPFIISNPVVLSDLLKIFEGLPFQSQNSLIKTCLNTISNKSSNKIVLKDEQEALHAMESSKLLINIDNNTNFCNSMLKSQKNALEEASALIHEGTKQLQSQEIILLEIQQKIIDWWDQPAQYIYPIQYENHTLKEWNDIIMMLLK